MSDRPLDPLADAPPPGRYVVGLDLGTTNSAAAFVDTEESPWRVRTLPLPQLVAPGQVESRETLPSCHYQPAAGEASAGALRLPWSRENPSFAVGVYARDAGALTPGRLIASAKSWLCHPGVDRQAEILPWHAAEDVERLSPVEASARYLRHVRAAWDAAHPDHPLADQDFVLTLPASFDEVARELTVAAAARAGLPRVLLIEEPQAAFYAWLDRHPDDWERSVAPGQKILVCDIGGGTSDFTLIRVRRGEQGRVQFHRVAVGEHLILGGDNLDLTLAHHLEAQLTRSGDSSGKLAPRQWDLLVRACRRVKEELLGPSPPPESTVHLPGGGSRLIGAGLQAKVGLEEARRLLLDGFFPRVPLDVRPQQSRSGFQEFGLPYAADPAVTKHLAAFLSAHRHVALDAVESPAGAPSHDPARPDIVLFNGGMFESEAMKARLLEVLQDWFRSPADPDWKPLVLANDRLDLAVARGAAYYGMVRRGQGVKITASLARSYYLGVETDGRADEAPDDRSNGSAESSDGRATAICILPGNAEPGQDFELSDRRFELRVAQPVEFPLYVSSTRLADPAGFATPYDPEQMKALPPIRTALRSRRRSDAPTAVVSLHARLTEIGTLDLWCAELDGPRTWRLQFDVRSATETDREAHESQAESEGVFDESLWDGVRATLERTFGESGDEAPDGLVKRLTTAAGLSRDEWPTSLLRRVGEALFELDAGRKKSPVHEARWLNLLGYALRPGYGLAVDDWRVAETWKLVQGRLAHHAATGRTESLILWRRVAGGLTPGQQRAIAEPLLGPVRALHRRLVEGKDRGGDSPISPHEATEVWRLLGSLELLPVALKRELGRMALDLAPKRKLEAIRSPLLWAVGRLGARQPLYGPLNTVLDRDEVAGWLERLFELDAIDPAAGALAALLLARRTGDRYRDLDAAVREKTIGWMELRGAPQHWVQLVAEAGRLDVEEQGRVFGEALPKGLRIV